MAIWIEANQRKVGFWEIEPKCLILIANLELSLAKAGRNRGFL